MTSSAPQFGKLGGKAGLVLAGLGLAAMGLGINGVTGQVTVQAQLAYLVSGGLLGLALVALGAAMLVVQGAREDRALLEAKLDLLAEAFLEGQGRQARAASPSDASGLVVAGTASFHAPGCRLVDGRDAASYLTPDEARARALKACRVCRPDSEPTRVTVR